MLNNVIPPELTHFPERFLRTDGLSLSVGLLKDRFGGNVNALTENKAYQSSDILWLSQEVYYHLSFNWAVSVEELEQIESLQARLMSGGYTVANNLLGVLIERVLQMGEITYLKMVGFDNGTPEGDSGENRLYQSSRLQECILLGIRLGIDRDMLEKWTTKLGEDQKTKLEGAIFPKKDIPK